MFHAKSLRPDGKHDQGHVESGGLTVTRSDSPIWRALLGLVAIPIFGLVASMGYDTYQQYESDIAAAYRTASDIRAISAAQTEHFLDNAKFVLSRLSRRPQIQSLDAAHCDPVLAELKQFEPAYANLLTLDANGRLVCSASGTARGQASGPDPKYYFAEVVRTGQFTVGKPARGFVTGRWVSTLAYPILNADGKLAGVVAIAVDLVNFRPALPLDSGRHHAIIGMINGDGTIIARSENADQRVGKPSNTRSAATMLMERKGAIRARDYQGIQRFFAFAPIANSDWIIFVALDEATVLSPVIQLALVRLTLVIALVLAVTAITILLARRIAKPVEAISKTMARVGAGAIHERADLAGPSELREIAVGLNAMLDARMRANAELRQSEERFRTAFRTSPDGLAITRFDDGRYLEVNDGFLPMAGWSRAEVVGKTVGEIHIWRYPEDREKLVQLLQENGSCTNLEAEFVAKDGREWSGLVSAHVMMLGGTRCIMSIIRDISDRKAADERIHSLSFSDPLTSLPNRRLFMDRLEHALISIIRHQRWGALVFVDLDDFKTINETLGHDCGDLVLREVARRLSHCVPEGDTVARVGGDEFVVVLEDLSTDSREAATQVEALCERILLAIRQPYELDGLAHRQTASAGIALFGHQTEKPGEALKRAELAMYEAKSSGRNALRFFDPQMQAAVSARAALEARLREAIDSHRFLLHYQAQVTDEGRIMGVEALVRWHDPQRGMISPAEFIPLAEESGLILPLGQWVLATACTQLSLWSGKPDMEHLTVSVNVSALQFHQDDFVDLVLSVLNCSGANPHRLKLEMTESMLVSNIEGVITKMRALKDIGVGFSLDDFGTGYSSLSYLKRLPLDQIKIDQGFVRDILIDPNDAAIAKMVIALAASMGLTVIAEGVETGAQRDTLADLGCRNYQGYLFSRPLPALEFEAFIQQRAWRP